MFNVYPLSPIYESRVEKAGWSLGLWTQRAPFPPLYLATRAACTTKPAPAPVWLQLTLPMQGNSKRAAYHGCIYSTWYRITAWQ